MVFTEKLPRGRHADDRGHIVWILLGTKLMRCSVYSVRPASDAEFEYIQLSGVPVTSEDPEDIVPRGQYEDWTGGNIPGHDEREVTLPREPGPRGLVRERFSEAVERGEPAEIPVATRRRRHSKGP